MLIPMNLVGINRDENPTPEPIISVPEEVENPHKDPKLFASLEGGVYSLGEPIILNMTLYNAWPEKPMYSSTWIECDIFIRNDEDMIVDKLHYGFYEYYNLKPIRHDGHIEFHEVSWSFYYWKYPFYCDWSFMDFSISLDFDGKYLIVHREKLDPFEFPFYDTWIETIENDLIPGVYSMEIVFNDLWSYELMFTMISEETMTFYSYTV